MTKARTLADFISDGSEFADGAISVAEVSGAAPTASPTFTGTPKSDSSFEIEGADNALLTLDETNGVAGGAQSTYISMQAGGSQTAYMGVASSGGIMYVANEYGPLNIMTGTNGSEQSRLLMYSSGEAVFNETSLDYDFRIESDNNTHMLFVDAGADHVNIGTSTDFGGTLNVAGVINQNRLAGITKFTDLSGDIVQTGNNNVTFASGSGGSTQHSAVSLWADDHSSYSGQIHLVGNTSNGGSVNAAGEVEFWTFNGSSYTLEAYMGPRAYVFNEGSRSVDFRVETDSRTHGLFLDASTNVLHVGGSTQSSSVGFINCGGVTFSNGSATNGKFFSWDNEGSSTDQRLFMYWFDGSAYKARVVLPGDTSEFAFNDSSEDLDFRVEGNNHTHALFVDGSTDRIGINTSSPTDLLHLADSNAVNIKLENTDTSMTSDQVVGALQWKVNDPSGLGAGDAGQIAFRSDSSVGGSYYMQFNTTSSASKNYEAMRISNRGQLRIGTTASLTSDTEKPSLHVKGGGGGPHVVYLRNNDTSGGANQIEFQDGSGHNCGEINSNATSNTTTYGTSSDHRLKENVTDVTGAIDTVKALQPRTYNFISDPDDTPQDGFIAHELAAIVPNAVTGEKDAVKEDGSIKPQQVDYGLVTPILTAALKEAIAKIETLEAKVTALENA